MEELQLQLQEDKSPLATTLEQLFRAFDYLTCFPHHAPKKTKDFFLWSKESNQSEKYEMVPYVINYYKVVDTLHILYDILKAMFPAECTADPHLPKPRQCQQKKYVNCHFGADCKDNNSSSQKGCNFRHADELEQQHDARLAQDYDGERSRFFDMYHRMALHCCKYGLSCYGRCGYRHHSNCTCAAEYLARKQTNSCGSASPDSSFNGSCSSDCTGAYDGIRPTTSSSSSSGSTTVEAFDSKWPVVATKGAKKTTSATAAATTTAATATASVFNKSAKGRKGVKSSSSTVPLLPTLTTIGTTATMNSKAPPTWCDKTKSASAYRLEKLGPKKTTTK
jgi:hypothetical protein